MRINEIFYSLQGEGYWTGQAAVFVRFSGCNLKCPFCDTDFKNYTEMSERDILREIDKYPTKYIILTGGEPSLQITQSFITLLHIQQKYVMIETNGTNFLPDNIDWITCSPKSLYTNSLTRLTKANESKVVVDDKVNIDVLLSKCPESDYYYIQPCDTGDKEKNELIIQRCINYIKDNPKYRLSLQTQKILNIR